MYLRVTERRNRDGSSTAYYALAENVWNATAKRSEVRVAHSFGRADRIDKAALQRLVASINRVIDADAADALPRRGKTALPEIEIDAVFELGIVLAARSLWEELGIGEAIRTRMARAELAAPHEVALFAMAAQRLSRFCLVDQRIGFAIQWRHGFAGVWHGGQVSGDSERRATRRAWGSCRLARSWRGRPGARRAADACWLDQSQDRRGVRRAGRYGSPMAQRFRCGRG